MRSTLLTTALVALSAINAFAQNSRPKPTPVPTPTITAAFATCSAGDTNCQYDNRVRSDGGGIYTHGQQGVKIEFYDGSATASRDLIVRLDSSTRTVAFDLRHLWAQAGTTPAWTSTVQNLKPMMNVLGGLYARENCADPTAGCTFAARMNAALGEVGGVRRTTYALLWNPRTIASNNRPVNDPWQTSDVLVHYIKNPTTGVEVFTISAQLNGCLKGPDGTCPTDGVKEYVAGLEQTAGRDVSAAGQYRMPFTFTVTVTPPAP
jgi:hypothetical protein